MSLRKVTSWFGKPHKDFSIELKHWTLEVPSMDSMGYGPNKWNLYVYIRPSHPLFALIKADCEEWNDPNIQAMNLHGGCTYCEMDNQTLKVGCDYCHLNDQRFTYADEPTDELLADAENLWKHMNALSQAKQLGESNGQA